MSLESLRLRTLIHVNNSAGTIANDILRSIHCRSRKCIIQVHLNVKAWKSIGKLITLGCIPFSLSLLLSNFEHIENFASLAYIVKHLVNERKEVSSSKQWEWIKASEKVELLLTSSYLIWGDNQVVHVVSDLNFPLSAFKFILLSHLVCIRYVLGKELRINCVDHLMNNGWDIKSILTLKRYSLLIGRLRL